MTSSARRPRSSRGTTVYRRYFAVLAIMLTVGLHTLTACGNDSTTTDTRGSAPGPGVGVLNPYTVDDLIALLGRAGLPVPNPRQVTERDCPRIGCTDAVETDTVAVMKFPTSGQAQVYAGSVHDRIQMLDVVMTFDPAVPPQQRQRYEAALKNAIK